MKTNIENQIIEELGSDHVDCIQFNDVITHDEIYGLYTYKGNVHTVRAGMDILFSELSKEEQEKVYGMFLRGNWVVNPALQ